MKNKYDTSVVFLYATGNEHLLPRDFRKQIPYTTIASWRKADFSKYKGHEFRKLFNINANSAQLLYENSRLKQAMMSFARSWVSLSSTIIPIVKKPKKTVAYKDVFFRQ